MTTLFLPCPMCAKGHHHLLHFVAMMLWPNRIPQIPRKPNQKKKFLGFEYTIETYARLTLGKIVALNCIECVSWRCIQKQMELKKVYGRPSWLDLDLEEEEGSSLQAAGERKEKFLQQSIGEQRRRRRCCCLQRAAEYFSGTSSSNFESAAHICFKVPRGSLSTESLVFGLLFVPNLDYKHVKSSLVGNQPAQQRYRITNEYCSESANFGTFGIQSWIPELCKW